MARWPTTTIGAIIERDGGSIKTGPFGTALKAHEYTQHGVPLISVGEVGDGVLKVHATTPRISPEVVRRLPEYVLRSKDIVFGRKGAVERSALIAEDQDGWFLGSDGIRLRLGSSRAAQFISYALRTKWHRSWIMQHATGSTMASLNQGIISRIPVPDPPIEEQEAIASVLSALDDRIKLNRRMNETLEASARGLFRDWFVDFGPTRAKAEGRPAYLAPDLWSLFPDHLGDDDVPEGWKADTLAAFATLNPEAWGAKDHPDVLSYVDLSNTKWGYIEKIESYDWADAPSRARRVLRPGDTIVGTVRPGNGSYAYVGELDLTGSTGFAVLRPKNERDQAIIWCAATSPENIERLAHLADGGAYPAVRPEAVLSTEIQVPSSDILSAFAQVVAPLLEQVEANKIQSRILAATRDALLPKLMSGELRVRDAEVLAA